MDERRVFRGGRQGRERSGVWKGAGAVVLLAWLLSGSGCTPVLYNIDVRYRATREIRPVAVDGRKYSVTVASFADRRQVADPLLIGRVIRSDESTIPILPMRAKPPEAVASALRDLLARLGYAISPEQPAWNLAEGTIRADWGTLLVGGAIESLDVTCLETLTTKRYSAKARLTLVFADVQKKRIFYRVTTESSSSLDHFLFSEVQLGAQINGVLSDAIEKALDHPETTRQIRDALKP